MTVRGEVVTVVSGGAGGYDDDGYWHEGSQQRTPVPGSVVDQTTTGITTETGVVVTSSQMRVLFPRMVSLSPADTLEIRGRSYVVDGRPFLEQSAFGQSTVGGTVVMVKEAST